VSLVEGFQSPDSIAEKIRHDILKVFSFQVVILNLLLE
jgi:hypothetical protein